MVVNTQKKKGKNMLFKKPPFKVKRIVNGELEENCYILIQGNDAIIIDPGSQVEDILVEVKTKNLLKILVTHKHTDHIGALFEIVSRRQVDYLSFEDLKDEEYKIGPFKFEVIFNPGHSADSVSFYFKNEKRMFVGDFIFKGSIGRCDLPTGNMEDMKKSLEKLKTYDEKITLYPGHGDITTIKEEKENNIYLK